MVSLYDHCLGRIVCLSLILARSWHHTWVGVHIVFNVVLLEVVVRVPQLCCRRRADICL